MLIVGGPFGRKVGPTILNQTARERKGQSRRRVPRSHARGRASRIAPHGLEYRTVAPGTADFAKRAANFAKRAADFAKRAADLEKSFRDLEKRA
jgi:hypothetical protein